VEEYRGEGPQRIRQARPEEGRVGRWVVSRGWLSLQTSRSDKHLPGINVYDFSSHSLGAELFTKWDQLHCGMIECTGPIVRVDPWIE
jgi:hypothetical protein